MKLTRRRRRKIYKGVGIAALIALVILLIMINPFKYIHIEFKPIKWPEKVLKSDDKTETDDKKKAEEEAKLKAEAEAKKKEEEAKKKEEEKKKQQEKTNQKEQEKKNLYYTVTFFNNDGSVLKIMSFRDGAIPYYNGDTPYYYDGVYYYQFVGWNKTFSAVHANTSYIAQYKVIGVVPQPTPTEPDKPDKPDEPDEPEEPEGEVEDLTKYNLLSITNTGESKGRIQIIKGVGDYSSFEEPLNALQSPEIHLQYSTDKIHWKDFNAYGEYDICGVIAYLRFPDMAQALGIKMPEKITNAKNPLIINSKETVYFRVPSNYDNPGFSNMVELSLKKYRKKVSMPCVNIFDIQGVDTPDATTFEIGGDLMSIIDDGYVNNGKDNDKDVEINELGFAGLFANISDDLFCEITGKKISSLKTTKENEETEEFNAHTGDNVKSAMNFRFPSSKDVSSVPVMCYAYMFSDSNALVDAPNIDVGILGEDCYLGLFSSCDGLEKYPYILKTELKESCYEDLFSNCIKLKSVDSGMLPLTSLAGNCYRGMFSGTSLEELPTLPATKLADYCYAKMYSNCSTLDSIDLSDYLLANTLADGCYYYMFENSSIDELPNLIATEMKTFCYSGMFSKCNKLTTVPTDYLKSTNLANQCYDFMFAESSITTAPDLPATTIYDGSYNFMFYNCKSLSTGPIIKAKVFNYEQSIPPMGNMFDGCTNLTSVTLINDEWDYEDLNYFTGMFAGTDSFVGDGKRRLFLSEKPDPDIAKAFYEAIGLSEEYWDVVQNTPQKFSFLFSFLNKIQSSK